MKNSIKVLALLIVIMLSSCESPRQRFEDGETGEFYLIKSDPDLTEVGKVYILCKRTSSTTGVSVTLFGKFKSLQQMPDNLEYTINGTTYYTSYVAAKRIK